MCGVPVAGLQGSIKFKGSKLRKLLRKIHDQGAAASQLRSKTVDERRLLKQESMEKQTHSAWSY